jgi:hypothetical protein
MKSMVKFYLSNQTWVFPSNADTAPVGTNGDVFASITPYWITTAGRSYSDLPYLRAALEASRNLPIETKSDKIGGISSTGSQKCRDMLDKVHAVQKANGGGGVVMGLIDFAKDKNVTIKIGAGGKGGVRGVSNLNGYGGVESIAENSYFSIGTTVVTANAGGGDPGSTSKDTTDSGAQTGAVGGSSSGSRSGATGRGEATRGKVEDSAGMVVSYSVLGNQGGAGYTAYQAGGGGGATAEGESGTSHFGGNGGEGIALDISGRMVVYGSGGGGGTVMGAAIGAGVGGTGAGNGGHTTAATSALANQGGGGGGAGRTGNGGNGGSGIVVFRYVMPSVTVKPGGEAAIVDTEEDVEAVEIDVKAPENANVTDKEYKAYFTKSVTLNSDGKYEVTAVLNPEIVAPVIATTTAEDDSVIPAIAISADGTKATINIENELPGLNYGVRYATTVEAVDSADPVSGLVVDLKEGESAGFFRVVVDFKEIGPAN